MKPLALALWLLLLCGLFAWPARAQSAGGAPGVSGYRYPGYGYGPYRYGRAWPGYGYSYAGPPAHPYAYQVPGYGGWRESYPGQLDGSQAVGYVHAYDITPYLPPYGGNYGLSTPAYRGYLLAGPTRACSRRR